MLATAGIIFVVTVAGDLFDRAPQATGGAVPPGRSVAAPDGEPEPNGGARTITLHADRGGHYWLEGRINSAPVRFMVDTGATGIALGPNTARAAGFRLSRNDYTLNSRTANGIARAAPVTIRRLRVGPIRLRNAPAVVMERPMGGTALLGMSFLGRLESYEVRDGRMTLRW